MNENLQNILLSAFNKNVGIPRFTLLGKLKLFWFGGQWALDDECCSHCGNKALGKMNTLNLRFCPNCNQWFKIPK